jgi:hypothetical protein
MLLAEITLALWEEQHDAGQLDQADAYAAEAERDAAGLPGLLSEARALYGRVLLARGRYQKVRGDSEKARLDFLLADQKLLDAHGSGGAVPRRELVERAEALVELWQIERQVRHLDEAVRLLDAAQQQRDDPAVRAALARALLARGRATRPPGLDALERARAELEVLVGRSVVRGPLASAALDLADALELLPPAEGEPGWRAKHGRILRLVRDVLDVTPVGAAVSGRAWASLARWHVAEWRQGDSADELRQAVDAFEAAERAAGDRTERDALVAERLRVLLTLAGTGADRRASSEAVAVARQACAESERDPGVLTPTLQGLLGRALLRRFEEAGDPSDLREAQLVLSRVVDRPTVALRGDSDGSPDRAEDLQALLEALVRLYEETGDEHWRRVAEDLRHNPPR